MSAPTTTISAIVASTATRIPRRATCRGDAGRPADLISRPLAKVSTSSGMGSLPGRILAVARVAPAVARGARRPPASRRRVCTARGALVTSIACEEGEDAREDFCRGSRVVRGQRAVGEQVLMSRVAEQLSVVRVVHELAGFLDVALPGEVRVV